MESSNTQLPILLGTRTIIDMENFQYIYNFVEGGWNTVWARSLDEAKRIAIAKWDNYKDLTVNLDTIRLASVDDIRDAMNTFN